MSTFVADPVVVAGQHIYPRRHIFEQACGVLAEAGVSVPIFNDKHLSCAVAPADALGCKILSPVLWCHSRRQRCSLKAGIGWRMCSYSFEDARWMVNRAKQLGCPLASGSSLPFAFRKPWLEHPVGVELEEAIVVVRHLLAL